MTKANLKLIIDIYGRFNSTCIIDAEKLTYSDSYITMHFRSMSELATMLLIDINEYTKDLDI